MARITTEEQRGVLTYAHATPVLTQDGVFRLSRSGDWIEARVYRGSRRWIICKAEQVIDFTPHAKAGASA